jgi:thimet oligopeptidase
MTQLSSTTEEFVKRNQFSLHVSEALLSELQGFKAQLGPNTLLDRLNTLLLELENVRGDANLFSQVHPDLNARRTAEQFLRQADSLQARLMHSIRIYEALEALDESSVRPLAWRFASVLRQDMRRAGVTLGEEQQRTARRLRDDLLALEQEFARNIRDDVRQIELGPEDLEGLPSDYLAAHPLGPDGVVHISTRYPDYYPFMSYAASENARIALLHEFYNRAGPSNLNVLSQLLAKRQQLAELLGYSSWADYVTEDKMVGSARNAGAFLDRVEDAVRVNVQSELADLLAFKRRQHAAAQTIGLWESLYYQQCAKAERFVFDARVLRPYFEYRSVKNAILSLNGELFGLTFLPACRRRDVASIGRVI